MHVHTHDNDLISPAPTVLISFLLKTGWDCPFCADVVLSPFLPFVRGSLQFVLTDSSGIAASQYVSGQTYTVTVSYEYSAWQPAALMF